MARPNFYMIGDNPNVSLGIVDCNDDKKKVFMNPKLPTTLFVSIRWWFTAI